MIGKYAGNKRHRMQWRREDDDRMSEGGPKKTETKTETEAEMNGERKRKKRAFFPSNEIHPEVIR